MRREQERQRMDGDGNFLEHIREEKALDVRRRLQAQREEDRAR